jgi:osmoprotectant transport system substrate-binding protein
MVLAGCGDDGGSSGGSGELDGVSITVGSKDFTENILLGEMLVLALENEGADVTNKINIGGTSVSRDALESGEIDVMPEYNGTGWTVHLGQEDPSTDPEELFTATAEKDLKENDIKWVGRSPFNDTYGFAANGDLAEDEGGFDFQGMADYLEANPDTTVCMETEFPDRPDGLVLFEKATGYEVPRSQIKILDTGLIYTETDKGACDFGEVFTTDGRITALNLELVEDPGVMILYNVSYTFRNEVYKENAELYDQLADDILADLDNEKMAELNAQVDVDGMQAEQVAEDYLKEIGLL